LNRLAASALAFAFAGCAVAQAAAPADYAAAIEAWRKERVAQLTTPDGWLTLIGLHFLEDGANTVGRAQDNDIVFAQGPAHFGTATVADGKVTFALADGLDARIDGQAVRRAELREPLGQVRPTLVTAGTVSFFAIERGGKKALRVRDSAAERRTHFAGIDYFPIDPAWRIEARWEPFETSRLTPITNILGQTAPLPVPGRAVFEHEGKSYALLAIDEGWDEPLFFVISDATSGQETYGACRFIYAARPKAGEPLVLDFNRAENPPCAFTPFATCPLPPKENRLPFAVNAGEKNYRAAPH
jgi:uncharacterized protein (DUF1684 family)